MQEATLEVNGVLKVQLLLWRREEKFLCITNGSVQLEVKMHSTMHRITGSGVGFGL